MNAEPTLRNITATNNSINGIDIPGINLETGIWSNTELVYHVRGDATILANNTLIIQPGVKVKLLFDSSLFVDGTLNALGSASQPVIFTSMRDDSVGGDTNGDGTATVPAIEDWGVVQFNAGSNDASEIAYVQFRFGGNDGFSSDDFGVVRLVNASPTLSNLTAVNNFANAVEITAGSWQTAHLQNPGIPYFVQADVTILPGETMSIGADTIVKLNYDTSIAVNGALRVEGTTNNRVTFTSFRDDTVGGDTNSDGTATRAFAEDWGMIQFNPGSTDAQSNLSFATFRYGGNDGFSGDDFGVVRLINASPTLLNLQADGNYASAIEIVGGQWDSAVFAEAGIPYFVQSDVVVRSGQTMIFGAAAIVKLNYDASIYIDGALRVEGNDGRRAVFTSFRDDSIGGDTNSDTTLTAPLPEDWGVIQFNAGSDDTTSQIAFASFRYAGNDGFSGDDFGVIRLVDASPTLRNLQAERNYASGVELVGGNWGSATFSNTGIPLFIPRDIGIKSDALFTLGAGEVLKFNYDASLYVDGTLNASGTTTRPIVLTSFRDDSIAGDTNSDGSSTAPFVEDWGFVQFNAISNDASDLRYVVFRYSGNDGFSGDDFGAVRLINASPILQNVTFTNNYINGVEIPTITLETDTWDNTDVVYFVRGDPTVPQDSVLTIAAGMRIKFAFDSSLFLNGGLKVQGTASRPVLFTSHRDDSVGGDTNNDGTATIPAAEDWGMIQFNQGSNWPVSSIQHASFKYGGNDGFSSDDFGVLRLISAAPLISDCTFDLNYRAIDALNGSTPSLINSQFTRSSNVAIFNNTPATLVEARLNWWGDPSGPNHPTLNPTGQGDKVSDGVTFDPWLTAPPQGEQREAIPLTLDTPVERELGSLQWADYSLDLPSGQSLLVQIQPLTADSTIWVHSRIGQLPNLATFEWRTIERTPRGTYELLIAPTQASTYYLSLFNRAVANPAAQVRVTARLVDRLLSTVTPASAGNAGTTTIKLTGLGFVDGMGVLLERDGSAPIAATAVTRDSGQALSSSFDLRGVAVGAYRLRVTQPGKPDLTLEQAFTINAGIGPRLDAKIEVPSSIRPQRFGTAWLNYTNTGDADLPAPLFVITTPNATIPIKVGEGAPYETRPIQVLGINFNGHAGILPPGASGRIPIYFQAATTNRQITFSLEVLKADTTPVNWQDLEPQLRPTGIDSTLWNSIWSDFKRQVGTTTADYQQALASRATYLARNGSSVYDIQELLGLMISRASGEYGQPALAASVDATAPSQGLALTFTRIAPSAADMRFHIGPFGRNWSHSFAFSASRVDDVTIAIEAPDRTSRSFIKRTDGTWQPATGDSGLLQLLADGTYQLRESDGILWRFSSDGRLASIEEANGNRLTLQYTGSNLTQISHSNGLAFTLAYNAQGRIIRLVDHAGRETAYTYDPSGEHLLSVTAPGNLTTTYAYQPVTGIASDHALNRITFSDATNLYYSYDTLGRLSARWRDNNIERVDFTYDELGGVSATEVNGAISKTNVGAYGQTLSATNPLGQLINFQYDQRFNTAGVQAPDGTKSKISYDSRGNAIQLQNTLGHTTLLGYTTDQSRLDWLRDPNGNLTNFSYDTRGNLTQITSPDFSSQAFNYDTAGNLSSASNRRGDQVSFGYNQRGQVMSKRYPDGQQVTYAYDAVGRVTSVTDSSGTISMAYDARGFLTSIAYPSGRSFQFSYNSAGRRTRSVSDDGYTLNYQYDAVGRLVRLTNGSNQELIRYEYDSNGRLSREIKGNNTTTAYTYDLAGRVLTMVNSGAGGVVQSRFEYTYDAAGNRSSMTTTEGITRYAYDAIGQLSRVTYPDGSTETYRYDALGNRRSVTRSGTTTAYTSNNLNQYTSVGDTIYSYDTDGNLISKSNPSGTTAYEYDLENRLVRVVAPGNNIWQYRYDALGNRTAVTYNGQTTRYVHDPAGIVNVAAEYRDDGTLIGRYVHGIGLVARVDPANNAAFYAFDALGNTRQMTDAGGGVANSYNYTPFGTALQATETIANPFQYVGRYGVMDEGHGLQFMRARYYDPGLGRFVAEDSIGLSGGHPNLYLYVNNDPVTTIDPSGNTPLVVVGAVLGSAFETGFYLANVIMGPEKLSPGGLIKSIYTGAFTGAILVGAPPSLKIPLTTFFAAGGIYLESSINNYFDLKGEKFDKARPEKIITELALSGINIPEPWGHQFKLSVSANLVIQQYPKQVANAILEDYFPRGEIARADVSVIRPSDPNDKLGPPSVGVDPKGAMIYTIRFENQASATASVQELIIQDQLDPDLDVSTLTFLDLGLGDQQVTVSENGLQFTVRYTPVSGSILLSGTESGQLAIDITGTLDPESGLLTWRMKVIDTVTGEFPEDPIAGMLPPEDGSGRGQGYVTFSIKPKAVLPLGTLVTNKASIIFDTNAPIETNEVRNLVGFTTWVPLIVR